MTTPRVTEVPLPLEPTTPDPFIEPAGRAIMALERRQERIARERRLERVHSMLRRPDRVPAIRL